MVRPLVLFTLVAACSSSGHKTPPGPDAYVCQTATMFTPVTVSGTSPGGSLDVFHYAAAGFVTGSCPDAYLINFTPTPADPTCAPAPWLQLAIYAPFTAMGSNVASATLPDMSTAMTSNVSFEATQLDPADATRPHIVGHFVSHDPAWSFDIAVDLISEFSDDCL
jgi:hypothetical protein